MRKEDINKYTTTSMQIPSQRTEGEFAKTAGATAGTLGGMVWRFFKILGDGHYRSAGVFVRGLLYSQLSEY